MLHFPVKVIKDLTKLYYQPIIETFKSLGHYITLVHADADFYLSWMQSMDSNYVEGATYKFTKGSGRLLYVNCPVDVYVYDSSNTLVGSIVDEIPNSETLTMYIDKNNQKIFYLPKDEDYTIKTIAREDCKTTITIDEYTGVSSDISKIISYSEIEMKEGEELIATATKYDESNINNEDDSGAIYVLKMLEEEITPDISVSKNQVKDYTYVITTECDEKQATVSGGGIFNIGEFCQVTVTKETGYIFEGWYIDDNKVPDEETYRFEVKENVNLIAKLKTADYTLGDINEDGQINHKDAKLALKAFANKVTLTEKQRLVADVNKDDKVDHKDAKLILKYFAGKITEFE